jgi:hypothetical protein
MDHGTTRIRNEFSVPGKLVVVEGIDGSGKSPNPSFRKMAALSGAASLYD